MEGTLPPPLRVPASSPPRLSASLPGLLSALTFGVVTPASKVAFEGVPDLFQSGWTYVAAGLGLSVVLLARGSARPESRLRREDAPWLLAAVLLGGVAGPYAFFRGIAAAPAYVASLLQNLEVVFTAALAVGLFGERATTPRALGAVLVTVGGVAVAWGAPDPVGAGAGNALEGGLWIALACLAWALDNNLTRKIAHRDSVRVARAKTLCGGTLSLGLAAATGAFGGDLPARAWLGGAAIGVVGIGVSLSLFVRSLRDVGATRTSVLLGIHPFVGAAASAVFLLEPLTGWAFAGAGAMAVGVGLVATERSPAAT